MSICQLVKGAHSVGEYNAHLCFTLADPLVSELTAAYLMQKSQQLGVRISAMEFGPDHVHIFVENWRRYAPAELARLLKGYTSFMMHKGHRALFQHLLWGHKFWTGGYFFRTVGAVTSETVKHYIEESQTKHW